MQVYYPQMSSIFVILFTGAMVLLVWHQLSSTLLSQYSKNEIKLTNSSIRLGTLGIIMLLLFAYTSSTANKQTTSKTSHTKKKHHSAKKHTTKRITTTQTIAFTTQDQVDSKLDKGTTQVAQAGQNGVKTLTYKLAYTKGKQTAKTLISAITTTQPVTQIIDVGTYVAPAPAPTPAPAPPATSASSCHPLSDEGNCYRAGEYCRESDAGTTGIASNGEAIICENNDGLRWEPN
jgi:hypothetical protein